MTIPFAQDLELLLNESDLDVDIVESILTDCGGDATMAGSILAMLEATPCGEGGAGEEAREAAAAIIDANANANAAEEGWSSAMGPSPLSLPLPLGAVVADEDTLIDADGLISLLCPFIDEDVVRCVLESCEGDCPLAFTRLLDIAAEGGDGRGGGGGGSDGCGGSDGGGGCTRGDGDDEGESLAATPEGGQDSGGDKAGRCYRPVVMRVVMWGTRVLKMC